MAAITSVPVSYTHLDYIISDNGIGMSEEFQKEMFNPFAREHDDTNTTEGTGLGLAITKNILDLMGGNINVSSKEGKGTTVIIHLEIPLAAKEQIVTNKIADNLIGDLNGKKVLLVEDHPLNTEIAEKILENKGVTVVSAKNGLDGLNKFRSSDQYEFDAILMDIRMPVMDGLETTKKIRKLNRPDAKNIPIIAMSANAYQEDIEKSLSAGINAVSYTHLLRIAFLISSILRSPSSRYLSISSSSVSATASSIASLYSAALSAISAGISSILSSCPSSS